MPRAWTYQRVVEQDWDQPGTGTGCVAPDDATVVLQRGPKGDHFEAWLKCPCGCGENVVLALKPGKANDYADWELHIEPTGRPTLKPSVNHQDGCKSHYTITDGEVHWH